MTSTDKLIKKYLKETKKNCPYALRKYLDAELKTGLIDFCELQDNLTMEKIEKRFGNPKQYAAEYLSLCDANDVDKKLNHSKKVKITILISSLILILLFIVTMICIIKHNETMGTLLISDFSFTRCFSAARVSGKTKKAAFPPRK